MTPLDRDDPEVRAALALIDAQIAAEARARRIPGLSVAVVSGQGVLWSKGYGFANLEGRIPATPGTLYRVASVTKVFTAAMLMQLRDAGKLSLDDPVERYLPEFRLRLRFADSPPPTFRQLAAHTAGLPRDNPPAGPSRERPRTIDGVLRSLADAELSIPPLTERKYSNLGISILGHALSRIAGQPYAVYVVERILRPLGMVESGFIVPPRRDWLDVPGGAKRRLAIGYAPGPGGEPRPVAYGPDGDADLPAGGLHSTVAEMARFVALQFRDGPAEDGQILRGTTLREMRQPVSLDPDWQHGAGIGWIVGRLCGRTIVSHGGAISGYKAEVAFIPSEQLGVAVFANTNVDAEIGRSALDLLLTVAERAAARRGVAAAAPEAWLRYTGRHAIYGQAFEVRVARGALAFVIPSDMPKASVTLDPERDHTFRMRGGPGSGELATFELGPDGVAAGIDMGGHVARRVGS